MGLADAVLTSMVMMSKVESSRALEFQIGLMLSSSDEKLISRT
jgi:hypothetical protein